MDIKVLMDSISHVVYFFKKINKKHTHSIGIKKRPKEVINIKLNKKFWYCPTLSHTALIDDNSIYNKSTIHD